MDKVMYVDVEIGLEEEIKIEVEEGGGGEKLPYYTGDYYVIPSTKEKVLETKNKSMSDNVTVLKIPKYEFDNVSKGQTVVIGGNE